MSLLHLFCACPGVLALGVFLCHQAATLARMSTPRSIEGGGSADVILYVGLAMISLGLLITFIGIGEGTKGFKTMEMKLIGPSLVGCGVFFAVLRILFCTVPSCCRAIFCCCRRSEDKQKLVEVEKVSLVWTPPTHPLVSGRVRI